MSRPPRLRIAAHNGAPVWGGAEIAVARIVAGLAARGHDAVLYCGDPEVERRAATLGAPTRRMRLGGDLALHDALRFARDLRRLRPDVLLLGTFRKVWLGALAARLAGVPRVVARIGLETDTPRNFKYRYVFRHWVDAVAFNADGMRELFVEALPEFPGRAVTIHTGIRPPAPGGGADLRARLGIPASARVMGTVGRLVSQKRQDRLVRALSSLPGVHALVVGGGSERPALERLAGDLGVAERLHFPGHQDDVGPALDAMDLFVLTSDREGFSNAMLEAMAAGVPVLSTDVSGAREALAPRGDGVAPGVVLNAAPASRPDSPGFGSAAAGPDASDPLSASLASAIAELLADGERLAGMGREAARIARERFGEARMLAEWEALLGGGE